MKNVDIEANGRKFEAELADNSITRAKGLSFRSEGKMLFVFPRKTRSSIDMMFLSDPLYLYFMNSEKEVIEVQEAEPWSLNPKTWRLYSPRKSYRYLLESFEDLGIQQGESLNF